MTVVSWWGLVVALALAACGQSSAELGAEVAAEVGCHSCHVGHDSELAPSLEGIWGTSVALSDGSVVEVDEAYVRLSITEPPAQIVSGYENARMPSFALTEDEVSQLVEYVRSLG